MAVTINGLPVWFYWALSLTLSVGLMMWILPPSSVLEGLAKFVVALAFGAVLAAVYVRWQSE